MSKEEEAIALLIALQNKLREIDSSHEMVVTLMVINDEASISSVSLLGPHDGSGRLPNMSDVRESLIAEALQTERRLTPFYAMAGQPNG